MNFYEEVIKIIKDERYNCSCSVEFDSKKEKFLKNKTYEQIKEEASKYGLYVKYENSHYLTDNPPYIFTLEPFDEIIAKITSKERLN